MIQSYVNIDNKKMEYFSFGSGSRTLVILPGLGVQKIRASARMVESGYSCFKEDFTVYVFDRKDDLPQNCTIRQIADDTARAMRTLGIKNADIFGVSMGGMIAQTLGVYHPELVHSLVLASTLSRPNPTFEAVAKEWINAAREGDITVLAEKMMYRLFTDEIAEKLCEASGIMFAGVTRDDFDRFIIQSNAVKSFDIYDELTRISCPVFVVGVEDDPVLTGQASREIAEKIGCELYMYGNEYRHAVFDEAPDYKQRVLSRLKAIC
ncbi:MAG TPA: alpha/beta hydrolase [Ruminococcaceae bacterium]|nr:alpha/beta hydrolase [Oscillospiraceae bacterium]